MGRILAIGGWMAWQIRRPFRRTRLARLGNVPVAIVVLALLALAVAPVAVPLLDPQPEDAVVEEILDGSAAAPGTWVRLTGWLFPLATSPTGSPGDYALLVDETRRLRSIVVRAPGPLPSIPPGEVQVGSVTGRVAEAAPVLADELPIEATEAGTPPLVVPDRIVELDAVPKPPRAIWWPLSILPLLLAGLLLVGMRVGYPIFRRATVVDVLAAPLGPGERLPAAYGGRVGPNERELADPGAALLLVRRGPHGHLLTAQPLADDGGVAPAPVTIGGSWTSGRIGEVHTLTETVPALTIRSELVDATFLFSRTAERDRVAALVAVER